MRQVAAWRGGECGIPLAHGDLTKIAPRLDRTGEWLAAHPTDRRGPTGGRRKNNRTDIERGKKATDQGVIQGYPRVAPVEATHQRIVDAHAQGTGRRTGAAAAGRNGAGGAPHERDGSLRRSGHA